MKNRKNIGENLLLCAHASFSPSLGGSPQAARSSGEKLSSCCCKGKLSAAAREAEEEHLQENRGTLIRGREQGANRASR